MPDRMSPLPALARAGFPRTWRTIISPSETRVAEDFNAIAHLYFLQASNSFVFDASPAILKISPSWGVRSASALRWGKMETNSRQMASASSTAGISGVSFKISATSARVSGEFVIPDPAKMHVAAFNFERISPSDSRAIAPFSSSGHPTQIADGSEAAKLGARVSGTKDVTSPTPARSAALVASSAAPGKLREPAMMKRCP